jgi:hypothetical protein
MSYPIRTAPGTPDAGYLPEDDLRHRPAPGGRMRDSLFWQCVMPEQKIGFQAYLYCTSEGKAGFNVAVIGEDRRPLALDLVEGELPAEADFDRLDFKGMKLVQPANAGCAHLTYESAQVRLDFDFRGLHAPFSYRQNPDGLPAWFAENRFEQTGRARGFIEFGGRRVAFDRIAHRDHSWGMREWTVPQHWKWLVAYTPDASRIVNLWIWIAYGEWGFGGYVVRDGVLTPIAFAKQKTDFDAYMIQRRFEGVITDVDGGTLTLELERFGFVRLPAGGRHATLIVEAACQARIDGRAGAGQFETQWPQAYLDRLKELRAAP